MQKNMYNVLEKYMQECMTDGAHDNQHIYRVLYYGLDIARKLIVDRDVLIAASLLHDIGRAAQFQDSSLDHAKVGAEMAYSFLLQQNWSNRKAQHVRDCIYTHRYRNDNPPNSLEAKILYDADKLDVTGSVGIARTLAYVGIVGEPLYHIDSTGNVSDGRLDESPSFFHEYHWKLLNVYDKFFTNCAKEIAKGRIKASMEFFQSMYSEVKSLHQDGQILLNDEMID